MNKLKWLLVMLCVVLFVMVSFNAETRYVKADTDIVKLHLEEVTKQVKKSVEKIDAEKLEWEYIGKCRVTTFCPYCNTGASHESSSGVYLEYGHVACSWLPIGTEIKINGEEFVVVDICGTDAIDIYIDHNDGYCHCNLNEYMDVSVKR